MKQCDSPDGRQYVEAVNVPNANPFHPSQHLCPVALSAMRKQQKLMAVAREPVVEIKF